jgi:hypothetical protein
MPQYDDFLCPVCLSFKVFLLAKGSCEIDKILSDHPDCLIKQIRRDHAKLDEE